MHNEPLIPTFNIHNKKEGVLNELSPPSKLKGIPCDEDMRFSFESLVFFSLVLNSFILLTSLDTILSFSFNLVPYFSSFSFNPL